MIARTPRPERASNARWTRPASLLSRVLLARPFGAIATVVIVGAVFQLMSGNFLTADEVAGIFTVAAPLGITGAGVALLMMSGEFDLSVGSMFSITPIVMGELMISDGWSVWTAFLVAMLLPLLFGLIHGVLTTRAGIPSFITTLGSYFLLDGAAFIITGGYPVEYTGSSSLMSWLGAPIGSSGFAVTVFWMVGITMVLAAVVGWTRFGNWSLAAGGRRGVGRALGVPTARVKTINFCVCAMLAGFAGVISFANVGSTAPGNGANNNLLAIVAAVLGGTSLFGIEGSIIGTMFGAVMLGVLETGLVIVGAPGTMYESMIGVILIIAVLVNVRLGHLGNRLARIGLVR